MNHNTDTSPQAPAQVHAATAQPAPENKLDTDPNRWHKLRTFGSPSRNFSPRIWSYGVAPVQLRPLHRRPASACSSRCWQTQETSPTLYSPPPSTSPTSPTSRATPPSRGRTGDVKGMPTGLRATRPSVTGVGDVREVFDLSTNLPTDEAGIDLAALQAAQMTDADAAQLLRLNSINFSFVMFKEIKLLCDVWTGVPTRKSLLPPDSAFGSGSVPRQEPAPSRG